MNKIKCFIFVVFCIVSLSGCKHEIKVEEAHYKALPETPVKDVNKFEQYVLQAPFEGIWDPDDEISDEQRKFDKDRGTFTMVIDTSDYYYPQLGNFHNDNDTLSDMVGRDAFSEYAARKKVIYHDPKYGQLYVFAGLLYDAQPLRLQQKQSGQDPTNFNVLKNTFSESELVELIVKQSANESSAIYADHLNGGRKDQLMYVRQLGQLVVQIEMTCDKSNWEKCLGKFKEVNSAMDLHDNLIANANVEQLVAAEKPISFWEDPYEEYLDRSSRNIVQRIYGKGIKLKTKTSEFKERLRPTKFSNVDRYFSFDTSLGTAWLTLTWQKTKIQREDFHEKYYEYPHYRLANKYTQEYFYYQISPQKDTVNGDGWMYTMNGIINFKWQYPSKSIDAKQQLDDLLQHIKNEF